MDVDEDGEIDGASRVAAEGGGAEGSRTLGWNGTDLAQSAIGTLKCLRSRMKMNERSPHPLDRAKQRRVLGCASV